MIDKIMMENLLWCGPMVRNMRNAELAERSWLVRLVLRTFPPIFIRKFLFYPQQQITETCVNKVLIKKEKNAEYAAEIRKNIIKNYLNFK